MTLEGVLIDFSLISMLLVIGAWMRRKIKFLQIYYIPVSLIAGCWDFFSGRRYWERFRRCIFLFPLP